ncbi:intercellular adhesion molecule 5 isoform X2 [Patagioenas fasciata]|uniref:intercellular adhesion molecule 5 isoform X2 n=1 Tax=Patagioenas fasciata TaxID=372321 RepID=UPI003A9A36F1
MAPPLPPARLLPPLILALAGAARGTFSVGSWPRVAVVPFGGSVAINCSRGGCAGGNATLGLDPPPGAAAAVSAGAAGRRWQSFRLLNVSRWDPGPATCRGRCGRAEANASTRILVYRLPERVVLEPVAPVAVGESRNLTCRVLEVAPLGNLTVTLRRGAETLRTQGFGGARGSASVAVSHVLTAAPGDHGQDVTCHAELSLRPHGPLFARAAAPRTLSVFALPEPPQLRAPPILEAGASASASCQLTGAFPAAAVRLGVTLAGQSLNVTVTAAGDVLTAATTLSPTAPGRLDLSCTAAVATAARTARQPLHVYRFPAPVLELSPAPVPAGAEVTALCRAGPADPPGVRLQLRDAAGGVLAEGPRPRLELRLAARREDDGRRLGCRASLALGDNTVTKDAAARLAVLYMPEMSSSDCPGNRTWLRGTQEALSCRATGNPAPTVTCGRNGSAVSTAEPEPVTRSRAGTYVCTAANSQGTRSRLVTVRVEYEPTLSERGCPARRTWLEGERRELLCRADGDPPPSTRCARDGDAARGWGGRAVTRADAGRYVCRATNKHGAAVRSVTVTVEYQPSLGDPGCPARRRWVEGAPLDLSCVASGNPPPSVACAKVGTPPEPPRGPNVTRAHAGTYECRATNAHGSAARNVTVAVESPRCRSCGCCRRPPCRWAPASRSSADRRGSPRRCCAGRCPRPPTCSWPPTTARWPWRPPGPATAASTPARPPTPTAARSAASACTCTRAARRWRRRWARWALSPRWRWRPRAAPT